MHIFFFKWKESYKIKTKRAVPGDRYVSINIHVERPQLINESNEHAYAYIICVYTIDLWTNIKHVYTVTCTS